VTAGTALALNEIDVDGAPELREQFGSEVPVLFIDGRKAFKYTVTARHLHQRLFRKDGFGNTLARKMFSPS
jgi:hypothetical protein